MCSFPYTIFMISRVKMNPLTGKNIHWTKYQTNFPDQENKSVVIRSSEGRIFDNDSHFRKELIKPLGIFLPVNCLWGKQQLFKRNGWQISLLAFRGLQI